MADPMVENAVCPTCGADIREEALFCYGCGKAVPGAEPDEKAAKIGKVSAVEDEDLAAAALPGILPDATEKGVPFGNGKGLRTAASMRSRPKTLERKNVEVSWVPPSRPSPLFYIVSLVLGLSALLLIALALYLR
jgi:hypothetical protein